MTFTFNIKLIPDSDGCVSNPCTNGGSCVNNLDSYSCYCQEGYSS